MGGPHEWHNWSGLEHARPDEVVAPADVADVVAAVRAAGEAGRTVRMVGSGHSFTGIARPGDVLLRPERLSGLLDVDRAAMTVTALAGTPLHVLNAELARLGLTLHNMGDIDRQTLAGATSTGTHGTGGRVAGLAAQLVALELVDGAGRVVHASAQEDPDLFAAARVGLGALGVLTSLTFRVEQLGLLAADERAVTWDTLLARYDEWTAEADHVDAYWFPHTDRAQVKLNRRVPDPLEARRPLGRVRGAVEDDVLANGVFGAAVALGRRAPAAVPAINRVLGRCLSTRTYSDVPHRVFTAPRRVRFVEMEYAVPREVGLDVLRECRRVVDRSDWRIGFPVEIRNAPAEEPLLSTASGRDSFYLAFHVPVGVDHTACFTGVEPVLRAHGGRPHWGKLHTMGASDLAAAYPGFEEFLAVRDRLDPGRVFTNAYLRRVLGD